MVRGYHIGSMVRNVEMFRAKAVVFFQEFNGNVIDGECFT